MVIVYETGVARGRWVGATLGLVAVFAVGLVVGRGWAPAVPPVTLTGPLAPPAVPLPDSLATLSTLHIDLAPAALQRLQRIRDRSLKDGFLVTDENGYFDAGVRMGEDTARARVRLKGDFVDHVDTGKWSLRVELLDGATLMGMSRFSVQHPKTRGFLMEWTIMAAARREGLLAPRADFVAVSINGNSSGAYYLEEHFTKELLESQGRREGPIVRFREDTFWSALRQHDMRANGIQVEAAESGFLENAEIGAYDEGRLAKNGALDLRLQRALDQLRVLQWRMAAARGQPVEAMAAQQALRRGRAQAMDEVFAAEPMGRMLALYSLFRCIHGLAWHQYRFYHDPVRDRLEPVVFDTGAEFAGETTQLAVSLPELEPLFASEAVYEAAFAAMERMGEPGYVRDLAAALAPDLRRFAKVLFEEGLLPSDVDPALALTAALAPQAARLLRVSRPADPANFFAVATPPQGEGNDPVVYVEAWTTTATPVLLRGFHFSNGRFLKASAVAGDAHSRKDGAVALPRNGERVRLRVPLDSRLWGLRDIQSVKDAIRSQLGADQRVRVELAVELATVGGHSLGRAPLTMLRRPPAGASMAAAGGYLAGNGVAATQGRPVVPGLDALLRQHPFLVWDLLDDGLRTQPGVHDVDGDLLVPKHMALIVTAGTTLRFGRECVLWAQGPLHLEGSADAPAVLEPQGERFSGVLITDAEGESRWQHAIVRRAAPLQRGGWQTTGGVTFYHAPCALRHCRLEAAPGEDSLNVFGCAFSLEDCVFAGGASDLLDGDFVRGTVRRCAFADSGEDAVDLSGSQVEVVDCTFRGIGDKAFSLGEGTHATVRRCEVVSAAIALAAKDRSQVEVDGLTVGEVEHFHIAVFVKKSEFGPATVRAQGLDLGVAGRAAYLVQQGCHLTVDGVAVPGQAVDVDALYQQKILGK